MNRNSGFTMMEAAVSLFIVAILASILVPLASSMLSSSRGTQGYGELQTIYTAIVGNPSQGDFGYLGDVGDYPTTLTDLITPSVTTGWNGPYLNGVRTDSSGRLLDPYGGVVEYAQVTSSGTAAGADYLALVSKGPDLTSNNPNQSSNARGTFTSNYPWVSGYASGTNSDNVLYPNIIDSPGQVQYQSTGTLSYELFNFDVNSKVNATVPACPALYQMTFTSVPRGSSDSFTLMYSPGGGSVDLVQGLWNVSIANTATNTTVFNEQVAVQPGGQTNRTVYLPPIDSSQTASFTFTLNNQSGAAADIINFNTNGSTKVNSTASTPTVSLNGCEPVLIRKDPNSTILDSFTMPYKAYERRQDATNVLVNLQITDTGVSFPNTLLKVYEGGTSLTSGVLIGTVSFKSTRKVKTFYNVKVNDFIIFETQTGSQLNTQTYTVVSTPTPNVKTIP